MTTDGRDARIAATLSLMMLALVVLGSCAERMQRSVAEPMPTARQELLRREPTQRTRTEEKVRALQESIDKLEQLERQHQGQPQ